MTGEEIFRELGGIDSQLVLNAAPGVQVNMKKSYKKLILIAACFVMFFGAISYVLINIIPSVSPVKPGNDSIMWAENLADGHIDPNVSEKYNKAEMDNLVFFKRREYLLYYIMHCRILKEMCVMVLLLLIELKIIFQTMKI